MTDTAIQNTAVNLDGLLEVLGKNLYSSPNVAIRELIQNAADACQRHRLEDEDTGDYFIRLTCLPSEKKLIIEDNGSGLTLDEVKQFLATIGSGYSRLLRHETGSEDIVGYFGLGFLTAYVVSSKVQVITSSYQTPDTAWKFTSAKGKTYAIAPSTQRPRGTTVTLWLEDEYENLSSASFLRSIIQKYCCLLQVPIHINEEDTPVNDLRAPWLRGGDISPLRRSKLDLEFANIFETLFEPIAVFPIPEDNAYDVKGLLWVQGGSSYATTDNRNVSLFTRNMFITDEDKELLPRWAGFCGGVLESAQFKPTASRESLQRDTYYQDVSAYLRRFLTSQLTKVVLEDPATWRRIISRHGQALLGAAISDDRLFETSSKTLKVPTTDGELTIPELLGRGDGKIYIKPSSEAGHEEVLFRARGNPLVKGYLYGATGFCQKYQDWHGVSLNILGSKDSQEEVFPPHTPEPELEKVLRALFETKQYAVAFTKFAPERIPLIIMEEQDIITKKRLEADEADRRISTAALSLARLTTVKEAKTQERTVYLNLDNAVIRKLPDLTPETQTHTVNMLKSLMEFLCLDTSKLEQGLENVFSSFDQALLSFIEGSQ